MEYLETFNEDGNATGNIIKRDTVHKQGLWHRVVHVWIYDNKGKILIQKRSSKKDAHPDLWDISAAGHIDIEESPETAVIRETMEELGIEIDREKLDFFDVKNINLIDKKNNVIDNEIIYIYLYKFNGNIKSFNIDPYEVSEIRFINLIELKHELTDSDLKISYVPFKSSYYLPIIDHISEIIKNSIV